MLDRLASWARTTADDPELYALAVRAQGWLLRWVLPVPRFRGTLVEPRLYIGSLEDAHSARDLEERRVRSVLTAAAEPAGLQPTPLSAEDFSVLQVDIECSGELGPSLRHSLPFLHDALARTGRRSVLVHSCGGNGRACAVAVAFLMQARGMQLDAAVAQVPNQSRCLGTHHTVVIYRVVFHQSRYETRGLPPWHRRQVSEFGCRSCERLRGSCRHVACSTPFQFHGLRKAPMTTQKSSTLWLAVHTARELRL